ncbi:MAG: alpha/beta hydrolase [Dehalococcoidia bacterium]|nr:alpha/beta hydrolase [Dehalococcoidia bacterium]
MARIKRGVVTTSLGNVAIRYGGRGRFVLLLHHTYGSSASWLRGDFLARLADSCWVFAPDTIGQGDSDLPPRPLEIADYADNTAEVARELGIGRATLIGHHTGAAIAVEIAARYPDLVDAVILSGLPFWTAEERSRNAARFQPWQITADGAYLPEWWQKRLVIAHGLTPDETHWQFLDFLKPGPRVVEPLQALTRYDVAARLPLVTQRALVLTALSDPFGARLDAVAALLPNHEVAIVADGALVHNLDPDAFLATVEAFLDEGA